MSFNEMNKEELLAVAESFAVDVDGRSNAKNIIAALVEDGITWEMYESSLPKEDDLDLDLEEKQAGQPTADDLLSATASFKDKPQQNYLLKMSRLNPTFEIRGYKFTKTHPFAIVKEIDVNWILENIEGFRIATPSEVREYYK